MTSNYTLFEAFRAAQESGTTGTAIDRARAGFQTTPEVVRTESPLQQQIRSGAPAQSSPSADRGWLGNVGKFAGFMLSGESFGNFLSDDVFAGAFGDSAGTRAKSALSDIPYTGGLLGMAFDAAAAPLTILTAGAGGAISAGIKSATAAAKIPVVGRFAGALIDPILTNGSFVRKWGVETVTGAFAQRGGEWALDRVPEDAPYPVQLAAGLLGGLALAPFGAAGAKTALGIGDVAFSAIKRSNPTGVMAASVAEMSGVPPTAPGIDVFAAMDGAARDIRSSILEAAGDGTMQQAVPIGPGTPARSAMDNLVSTIIGRQSVLNGLVDDAVLNAYNDPFTPIDQPVKPPSFAQAAVQKFIAGNGWYSRTPAARVIATHAEVIRESGALQAQTAAYEIGKLTTPEFGAKFEKVSLRPTALPDTKVTWDIAGKSDNPYLALRALVEHSEDFFLTASQQDHIDNYKFLWELNKEIDVKGFGIKVGGDIESYTPSYVEYLDMKSPGESVLSSADLADRAPALFKSKKARLGGAPGYTMPRTFEDVNELVKASLMNREDLIDHLTAGIAKSTDIEETGRLQAMRDAVQYSDVHIRPKSMTVEQAIEERLSASANARAEAFAIREASGFKDPAVLKDVVDVFGTPDVGGMFRAALNTNATLKQLILSLDLGTTLIQGHGAMTMGRGISGGMEIFSRDMMRSVFSDTANAEYMVKTIDRITLAQTRGLNLTANILEHTRNTRDLLELTAEAGIPLPGGRRAFDPRKPVLDDAGKPVVQGGRPLKERTGEYSLFGGRLKISDVNILGSTVRALNDIQFNRVIRHFKLNTYEHVSDLLKAARSDEGIARFIADIKPSNIDQGVHLGQLKAFASAGLKDMTDEAIEKQAATFVNNLYGGQSRIASGRTEIHNLVESLFLLTPGFTRGTLNIAAGTLQGGATGALSRDFAARGLILAASVVYGTTIAINGITGFSEGKPRLVTPNITDATQDNWMDIPLPNGQAIRPFSRFRAGGKILFDSLDTTFKNGPIDGTKAFTEDTLRWASYRQSALLSSVVGDGVGAAGNLVGLNTGN